MKTLSTLLKLGSVLLLGLTGFLPAAHALISASINVSPNPVSPSGAISISASGHCDQEPLTTLTVTQDGNYVASVTGDVLTPQNDLSLTGSFTAPGTAGTVIYRAMADSSSFTATDMVSVVVGAINTAPEGAVENMTGTVNQNQTFSASGWAGDPEDGSPVTVVRIYIDNVYAGDASLNSYRPDIATATGHASYNYSGWSCALNVTSLSVGTHQFKAVAVDSQSAQTVLGTQNFTVNPASTIVNGVTWSNLNAPATVYANASFIVYAAAANTGTNNWGPQHYLVLKDGSNNPISNYYANNVNVGAATTANWPLTAPATPGSYTYYYQALENGVEWFGPNNPVTFNVAAAPAATITTDNATLNPGESTTIRANFSTDTAHGDNQVQTSIIMVTPDGQEISVAGTGPGNLIYTFNPTIPGGYVFKAALRSTLTGNWTDFANVSVTVVDHPPVVTSAVAGTVNTGGIATVTWTASDPDGNFSKVDVWLTRAGSPYRDYLGQFGASGSTTWSSSAHFSSATNGNDYLFIVRATDSLGVASAEVTAPFTISTPLPGVPTGLVASNITTRELTLNWTAPVGGAAVTGYEVRDDNRIYATTAPTQWFPGRQPDTTYGFSVRSRDAAGNWSAWCPVLVVTTLADTAPPIAPTGLQAWTVAATSVYLVWNTPNGDDVAVTSSEARVGTTTVASNGSSGGITVVGLSPNTTYPFSVRQRDAAGNWSAWSVVLNVTTIASTSTDTTVPSVPANLIASNVGAFGFTLNWSSSTDNVGVQGYEVSQGGTTISTQQSNSPLIVSNLSPGTVYAMSVRSFDAAGNRSAWSPVFNVTTSSDATPPSVPTGLVAGNVTAGSLTLNWTAATDNVAVTGYEVRANATSFGTATGLSRNLTGLSPSMPYALSVRARDAAGNWSAWSAPVNVTMLEDTTPPGVPVLSVSSITAGGCNLNYPATDNVGVIAYEVRQGSTTIVTPSSISSNCLVTGLSPSTTYAFSARARDASGNWSAWSVPVNVTTLADATAPTIYSTAGSPWTLTATSVGLRFYSYDDVGVTDLEIRQGTTTIATPALILPQGFNWYVYTLTGLTPATTYAISLRARDSSGNWSAWSTVINFTTPVDDSTAPSVPVGLVASALTATGFTLNWTASTDNLGVTGYEVFKNGVSVGTTTNLSMALTGLTTGTAYSMKVRARDAVGNWSAQSTALSVTPRDPLADGDHDGLNDVDEALLGTSPTTTATEDINNTVIQLKVHRPNE